MPVAMTIPQNEFGQVRLFAIDLGPDDARAFADGAMIRLPEALDTAPLDMTHAQVFDADDLAGVGLTDYLIEGQGVDPDTIKADRARLDVLTGPLVVVTSSAFKGKARDLRVHAPLRWIGTWPEAQAAPAIDRLTAEAAMGGLTGAAPGAMPDQAPRLNRYIVLVMAALALILLAGLAFI